MRVLRSTHSADISRLDTSQIRDRFLSTDLFRSGEITFVESEGDRIIVGGAVPHGQPLELVAPEQLRAHFFLQRRELGIAVLSGSGTVETENELFELVEHDVLYVGLGTKTVIFNGNAVFYLVSTIAHRKDPTVLSRKQDAEEVPIGTAAESNARTIRKHIHEGGVASNQLAMGITTLEPGSVWNTLPPHTHERRTEIYLYFGLGDGLVSHFFGEPDSTRHIIVRDRQAVFSPPWSVHFGAGTRAYSFVWSTGGENMTYKDSESVTLPDLR